ncbi:MFS transporter [Actinomadura keratinilytica]|jgi:DHA2 family multidrug resistance protein-like MFS transporter|uniref:MFS transporter n=1 Tax=Actinomadura keratinilytica TaxID=547461 RepID=UPI003617C8E5
MNPQAVPSHRKWGTFVIGCLLILVPGIDLTALNLAVPHISADLDPSATQILWIADSYGFALAGLLITMGAVGDRVGHRNLLLIGVAVFAAASALTAYAPSAELLIAARALLGAAGATLMPSALALIRRVFTDPKERTTALGAFFGSGALAVGLGPVLGGGVLEHFWWGAVFLINVPIMAVILAAGAVLLPGSHGPGHGRVDVPSVPLSAAGVLGVVYAVKEAAAHGLDAAQVRWGVAVGAAGLALFLWRQTRLAHPLIDVRLFRRAAFTGSVTINLFAMFGMVAQSLLFSLYFQLVLGWSPLRAGLAGLPGAVGAAAGGAALAAPLISAVGRARTVAVGMAVAAVSYAAFTGFGTDPSYPLLVVPMVLGGLGMGLALTVTGDTVLASVPRRRAGTASAISETAAELGGALGMAVLGSVVTAVYRRALETPSGLPAGAEHAARESLASAAGAAAALPQDLAARLLDAARTAYVDGMHAAMLASAAVMACVAVTAVFTLRSVPKVIPGDAHGEVDGAADDEADGEVDGDVPAPAAT